MKKVFSEKDIVTMLLRNLYISFIIISAMISSDSLNLLMMRCTIDNEFLKFFANLHRETLFLNCCTVCQSDEVLPIFTSATLSLSVWCPFSTQSPCQTALWGLVSDSAFFFFALTQIGFSVLIGFVMLFVNKLQTSSLQTLFVSCLCSASLLEGATHVMLSIVKCFTRCLF